MSRATMSTGNILLSSKKTASPGTSDSTPQTSKPDTGPMHIAIVGDFSARGTRQHDQKTSLSNRRAISIDRDNFDEVFEALQVTLDLPVTDTPISFNDIDDLHPDFLYDRVPLFADLRTLKRKLGKPALFDEAAAEIQSWASFTQEVKATQDTEQAKSDSPAVALPEDMLEAVLAQSEAAHQRADSPAGNIDAMIKDIIAPYIEPKADPRLADMQQAVDDATGSALRKIMHASEFQALEARWRSVYMLVRRLETNRKLKLFLIDVSDAELRDDIESAQSIEQTQLHKLLVEKNHVAGATPYSTLMFDYRIDDRLESCRIASAFAQLGQSIGGVAIASAAETIAGCQSFAVGDDTDDWHYSLDDTFTEHWNALRDRAESAHLALAAPRFILRLPYGKKTSPIDSFDFEELATNGQHDYYLWGNSAFLVTLLCAQAYLNSGWQFKAGDVYEVDSLPLHVYEEDGESLIKPCAEIFIRDAGVNALAAAGLMSVRSIKGRDAVMIPRFRSIHRSGQDIYT